MRYMNPGFKEWLNFVPYSSSISNDTDATKTKTGTAICNSDGENCFLLDYPASGEIYFRFDFFYPTSASSKIYFGEWGNGSEPYNGFSLDFSGSTLRFLSFVKRRWTELFSGKNVLDFGLKQGSIISTLFHLKWADTENGIMELTLNDYSFEKFESADLTPYNNSSVEISFKNYSYFPVSNIIISDEPISIKEQLAALPITGIETDMAYDSDTGIYTASAVNQSLLASVDVADLINNFGSDSKVTGVTMVGNPAYRTAEGLSSFTALTKKNNTVTEYGAANIPADSDSVVANSFKVASDTTIGDLANMQLGLKVGG